VTITGAVAELDLADDALAAALVALQRAAYRVEAELIGFADLPPLRDDVASLRRSGETFLGAYDGPALAGVVSYRIDRDVLDIHRLVVDPARFRRGVGRRLLAAAEARAPRPGTVVVSTATANAPARALYQAAGYRETGRRTIAAGVFLTTLAKRLA
jgi:ribosomal protein S18 acetylase RimI-like enzyme